MNNTIRTLIGSLALLIGAVPVAANTLPQPTGDVVLTIRGAIAQTNAEGVAHFDMAMLEALPQRETRTETPWHTGVQVFSGPTMQALMDIVGAEGATLRIGALNDYAATMPMSDTSDLPVILATRQNGAPMSVREKGPLFVIYPFDEMPELFNEVHFSRSVWQVATITIED